MMSLYDRAARRCEQNILRRYPAWRQAHLTDSTRPFFDAWKANNVAHLQALRDQIVKGGTPDIDRGWPDPLSAIQMPKAPMLTAAEFVAPMEAIKARIDERRVPSVTASYTFRPAFLAEESREGEQLEQTDMRLLGEYEALEIARPLDAAGEDRRLELFNNFYEVKVGTDV